MARRSAHEVPFYRNEGLKGYEAIWSHIFEHPAPLFTISDIDKKTNVVRQTVRDYIKRLEKAGIIEKAGVSETNATLYKVIKKQKIAPRVNREGKVSTQGLGRYHMWQSMKMLKSFTKHELAEYATTEEVSVSVASAEEYIRYLNKAGYLQCVKQGGSHTPAIYRFIKNTGMNPPMIQRLKILFDPNIDEIVWPKSEESKHG